jgi:ATP-dependent protease ClpP protease subunit
LGLIRDVKKRPVQSTIRWRGLLFSGGESLPSTRPGFKRHSALVDPIGMDRKIPRTAIFCAFTAFLLGGTRCFADTLKKTNGQTLNGKVVGEDKDVVVFEVSMGGMQVRQRVPRSQIAALQKQVREGPGYVVLPIFGEIGVEVTADTLRRAITEAKRSKPQYIVLAIDSPGGLVSEKERIVDVIRRTRDVKFVAYVRQAVSAAAIVAMACPQIYMAQESAIGATVTVRPDASGKMTAVDEKIQSVVRATDRAIALNSGHSELWVRGMSDRDLELAVVIDHGHARVVEATGRPREQVIKRRGEIMTMTGSEAVEYGLAAGVSPDIDGIKEFLQLPAWHVADDAPSHTMINSGKSARAEFLRIGRIGPQVRDLDERMSKALARVLTAEAMLSELKRQHETSLAGFQAEYEKKMEGASRSVAAQAKIERMYGNGRKQINAHYENQIARCEEEIVQARAGSRPGCGRSERRWWVVRIERTP